MLSLDFLSLIGLLPPLFIAIALLKVNKIIPLTININCSFLVFLLGTGYGSDAVLGAADITSSLCTHSFAELALLRALSGIYTNFINCAKFLFPNHTFPSILNKIEHVQGGLVIDSRQFYIYISNSPVDIPFGHLINIYMTQTEFFSPFVTHSPPDTHPNSVAF